MADWTTPDHLIRHDKSDEITESSKALFQMMNDVSIAL